MKYTIFKGWNYSNFLPIVLFRRKKITLQKYVVFDKSCMYDIKEDSCVNKLFGVTHGLFAVHDESDRFGWTWNESQKFCIWAYSYVRGELRKRKIVTNIEAGTQVCLKMTVSQYGNNRRMTNYYVNDEYMMQVRGRMESWHTMLGFYFGGNTPAPHKMHIYEYNHKRNTIG